MRNASVRRSGDELDDRRSTGSQQPLGALPRAHDRRGAAIDLAVPDARRTGRPETLVGQPLAVALSLQRRDARRRRAAPPAQRQLHFAVDRVQRRSAASISRPRSAAVIAVVTGMRSLADDVEQRARLRSLGEVEGVGGLAVRQRERDALVVRREAVGKELPARLFAAAFCARRSSTTAIACSNARRASSRRPSARVDAADRGQRRPRTSTSSIASARSRASVASAQRGSVVTAAGDRTSASRDQRVGAAAAIAGAARGTASTRAERLRRGCGRPSAA